MSNNKFNNSNVTYAPKEKKLQNKNNTFSQQELSYDSAPLVFPPGLEKLFSLLYFISLPYIAGLMFLYFYVGQGKSELFLAINEDSSFILTWAIGYEILAVLVILFIIKIAIDFSIKNQKKGARKNFRRP